jgi:diguanylate cyclase (GGDEF)-like protein
VSERLPALALADADSDADTERRRRRRQAQSLGTLGAVFTSYALDGVLLAALWLADGVPGSAVTIYVAGGCALCALFWLVFRMGWNERTANPYLTMQQTLSSAGLMLFVAWAAPEAALLLLLIIFLVFAFAALQLPPRQLIAAWLLISVGIGALVWAIDGALSIPHATPAQLALSCVWVSLVLGRCAFVGIYGARLRQQLGARNRELSDARDRLHELATRDPLTGALNRRAIVDQLTEAVADGRRVAAVLVDLDHFKKINDRHGHLAGDQVLRRFVIAAAQCLRGRDRLGRYGGEEFLLVLEDVPDASAARAVAERVRTAIEAEDWAPIVPGVHVTASFGLAQAEPGEAADDLLRRADAALYKAKGDGRNRVFC